MEKGRKKDGCETERNFGRGSQGWEVRNGESGMERMFGWEFGSGERGCGKIRDLESKERMKEIKINVKSFIKSICKTQR